MTTIHTPDVRLLIARHATRLATAWARVVPGVILDRVAVAGTDQPCLVERLPWNAEVLAKAEVARWGGGTATAPLIEGGRRNIASWNTETIQPFHFDRHSFGILAPLAAAWRTTRESDYAAAACDYLRGFVTAHPDGELTNAHPGFGVRQLAWVAHLPYFLDHPGVDDDLLARLIAAITSSLNQVIMPSLAAGGNVRVFQANALLWCGLRLGWLPDSAAWIRAGVRIYNDAAMRQFEDDGSSPEHDPHYHGVPCPLLFESWRWSRALPELGLQVPIDDLARSFDYYVASRKPNGHECGLGDGTTSWHGWQVDETQEMRAAFRREAGLSAAMPATSQFFPDAGQVFLRSDWSRAADYVVFDAGRWGGAHSHLGRNSVTLHAHGRSLLVDGGTLTYHFGHMAGGNGDPRNEAAGPYGKSTRAHNTLNLNGWNQWTTNPDFTRHWHAPGVDVVLSRYSGGYWSGAYGWWFSQGAGQGVAAVHDRIMVWLRGRCVVTIDTMMRWGEHQPDVSENVRNPSLEMNWQLPPGRLAIDASARRVTTCEPDANLLMLYPLLPPEAKFSVHEGQTEPFRGWISDGQRTHTYIPAPQLCISCTPWSQHMGGLVSVLVPYAGERPPTVNAVVSGPITGGNFTDGNSPSRLELTWEDGSRDVLEWMPALDCMLTPGHLGVDVASDAAMLHRRLDPSGTVIGGALINGTWCTPFAPEALPRLGAHSWGLIDPCISTATEPREMP